MGLYPGCDCTEHAPACSPCAAEAAGAVLARARERLGLPCHVLARKAGLTTARLRSLETGRADLGLGEAKALAHALARGAFREAPMASQVLKALLACYPE